MKLLHIIANPKQEDAVSTEVSTKLVEAFVKHNLNVRLKPLIYMMQKSIILLLKA
ncbi:MAG: NAD(P)H-dependent oxidoreductase [Proteobacteria bacterium]|nr:NAD(P)H-dependent oxidoreductase [Pseudomonadota bacterium]